MWIRFTRPASRRYGHAAGHQWLPGSAAVMWSGALPERRLPPALPGGVVARQFRPRGTGSITLPSDSRTGPGGGLLWDILPALALVAMVLLGTKIGLGGAVRLLYPGLALAVAAALLLKRHMSAYACFCVWLFVLTPWLRRWVDLDIGWLRVNPVMMAPWAAGVPCLLMVPRMLTRPGFTLAAPMLVAILAASYGLVLAFLQGVITPGIFDWLRYAVPPCFAALIIVSLPDCPSLPRRVIRSLAMAAAVSGAYGIYQFTVMPPWDAEWMRNALEASRLNSIGQPEPFEVRVFSLLNSPQSFAAVLGAAIPFLLAVPTPLHLIGFALGVVGLLLSLVRSYWLALALALGYLLARSPIGLKMRVIFVVITLSLLIPTVAAFVPEAMERIDARFVSLTSDRFGSDVSYQSRQGDYEQLADALELRPLGMGLGTGKILDGQVMDTFYALGLFAGTFYLSAAAWCFVASARRARRGCPPVVLAASAVMVEVLLATPLTSSLIGELGMFSWLALALCHTPWRRD